MASFLDIDGIYDKTKRYIVTNWSDEDFTQHFGSETAYNDNKVIEVAPSYSITIKPDEMRELGQFEAFLFTRHFVTREMYKESSKLTDPELIKRIEMGINNREARKVYEDKTISEIKAGQATPFMDKLRAEIRKEELAKIAEEGEKTLEEIKKDLPEEEAKGEFQE